MPLVMTSGCVELNLENLPGQKLRSCEFSSKALPFEDDKHQAVDYY